MEDDFIAQGSGRRVYAHPTNPNLVIKIQKPSVVRKKFQSLRRFAMRDKRRFHPIYFSWVEIDEVAAMVARTGKVPSFCSQFQGFAQTNLGVGTIFNTVRAANGDLAPTLRAYVERNGVTSDLAKCIDQFWDEVKDFRAVIWDPSLDNFLVCADGNSVLSLTIIDGLGERTLIKVLGMSDFLYRRQIKSARSQLHNEVKALANKEKTK